MGGEALAWLDWLLRLPSSASTKAADIDPAWVQAVGSILAILAGFGTVVYQNRHAARVREAERARRAEVVAFRLTGWLVDTGVSLDIALRACDEGLKTASSGPPRSLSSVVDGLRLRRARQIDGVLPDLHVLLSGSGDVAQLNHQVQGYEAWLDGVSPAPPGDPQSLVSEYGLRDLYGRAKYLLTPMKKLQGNALRHIGPIIDEAARRGRTDRGGKVPAGEGRR
jgi:hypothetical protein